MTSIGSYSSEPFYTIKAVQTRSGIKPVTLRAWERRYDLLQPARMPNGYRLYSERDIQLLLWVQRKLNSGVTSPRLFLSTSKCKARACGRRASKQ